MIEVFRSIQRRYFAVIFIVLLFLLLPNKAFSQSSLYEFREFTVKIEKFPPGMNPYASVEIRLDGNGTFTKQMKTSKMDLEKTKNFKVTAKQLEYLYYQIMRARFFDMGTTFGNPNITDGTIVRVTVRFDEQIHTVTMYDERYLAIDELVNAVLSLIPPKLREEFKSKSMDFTEVKLP